MLSLTEVGLGSLLHAFHVPFSGHFLSLNQLFLLSRSSAMVGKTGSRFVPGSISFVAAALKSLSPAGKKLTPMLAISMQGLLFNIGILFFGHSLAGRLSGAFISALWGFVQPFLLYYCIFGKAFFQTLVCMEDNIRSWLPFELPSLWYLLSALVALKVVLALVVALTAPRVSAASMAKYTNKMTSTKFSRKPSQPVPAGAGRLKKIAWLAAKDMCVWPFIACVVLSGCSFWFLDGQTSSWLVWNMLRPVAVGFLLFFAMRILPMEKVATWLEKQHQSLGQAFRIALFKVRQM